MKKKDKKLIKLKCKIEDLIYKMEATVVRNHKGEWLGHKSTAFVRYEKIERKLGYALESKLLSKELTEDFVKKIKEVQNHLPFLDKTTND
jgi:hypothetical protein